MGTLKNGGERAYVYDPKAQYDSAALTELAPKVIETAKRDPQVGTLDELFGKGQRPLKRVGIVIFETEIQSTRGGLADKNEVFLSPQGKQLVTEKMLRIWEESIKLLTPEVDFVPTAKVRKAPSFHKYGMAQGDYVLSKRDSLAPDDIFFLESGKKTTTVTTLNPRGLQDMSFVLVPAYDLMGGPKWSEHNKHFLNDVSKVLKLDALIIVHSKVYWTTAHTDKHSGENISEEMTFDVKASTLVPLHQYHARLDVLKKQERPSVTLCYRAYTGKMKTPVNLALAPAQKTFETIEAEIVNPMFKTYKDLSQMMIIQLAGDLKKTW